MSTFFKKFLCRQAVGVPQPQPIEPLTEQPSNPEACLVLQLHRSDIDEPTATAVCDESRRGSTPYSTYRMSKRASSGRKHLSLSLPVKRRKTFEERVEEEKVRRPAGRHNSLNEDPAKVAVVRAAYALRSEVQFPIHDSVEKLLAFVHITTKHQEFLMNSPAVDKLLLAMVLIYFERAHLTCVGYTKDRYFFYALFLAMEMEEDAVDGLSEVIYYVVGAVPPRSTIPGQLSEAEKKWNSRLIQFYKGKDRFWARLNYRVYVSTEDCEYVARRFPPHCALQKTRTHEDLKSLKRF